MVTSRSPYETVIFEKIEELRQLTVRNYLNSRERSLAIEKLDEAELWLSQTREVDSVGYLVKTANTGEDKVEPIIPM